MIGRAWDSIRGMRTVLRIQSMNGRDVAIVQTGDMHTGHEIIDLDSLEKEIDFDTRQYQSRRACQEKAQASQVVQTRARYASTSLDGFEDTLTPLLRGVAIRALTLRGITSNGTFYESIRDLIRARVRDGWHVSPSRRFVGPDGTFLLQKDITKIGMDYAAYLSRG